VPTTRSRPVFRLLAIVAALIAGSVGFALTREHAAAAPPITSGGFTTSATVTPASVARRSPARITVSVTAAASRTALVDVEVYSASGFKTYQRSWDGQAFTAGTARTFFTDWYPQANQAAGTYTVRIGIFSAGWGALYHWNNAAASVTVVASTPPTTTTTSTTPTTTTVKPTTTTSTTPTTSTSTSTSTTTTVLPTTTTSTTTTTTPPTTTTPASGHFGTLPPGSALPSDATCASLVRPTPEIRPQNQTFNHTVGQKSASTPAGLFQRVTGNFTGTTDEIIQWVACKWGIDEDIVRAQTAVESWWIQTTGGDWTTDPTRCVPGHPIGADGQAGQCPESIGVQQVRYPYIGWAFPSATDSTAYNLDVAFAARRNCFEGNETWLNTVERGRDYAAGDIWGCVGMWFAGRWYTQPAIDYTTRVQGYYNSRIWETPGFR
jgi:hypothetical protein